MIYDEYIDLSSYDTVPLVTEGDPFRVVNLLIFPIKDLPEARLYMWVSLERLGYYLYISVVTTEEFWISIESGGSFGVKKILLTPKLRRGGQRDYYNAGIKASIHAKRIVRECFGDIEVDWEPIIMRPKRMSDFVFRGRELALAEEVSFSDVY